jgi:hypothetical protein
VKKSIFSIATTFMLLIFSTTAFADIRIGYPKNISPNILYQILTEEAAQIPDIVIKVKTERGYKPGSVEIIPTKHIVRIGTMASFKIGLYLYVEMRLNGSRLQWDYYHGTIKSIDDPNFKLVQKPFETLLARMYERMKEIE